MICNLMHPMGLRHPVVAVIWQMFYYYLANVSIYSIYIHIHLYIYIYIYMRVLLLLLLFGECLDTLHIYTHIYMYIYICIYVCVCVCVCVRYYCCYWANVLLLELSSYLFGKCLNSYSLLHLQSPFSNLKTQFSISLRVFCHVPLKRDKPDQDWRIGWNDTPNAIGPIWLSMWRMSRYFANASTAIGLSTNWQMSQQLSIHLTNVSIANWQMSPSLIGYLSIWQMSWAIYLAIYLAHVSKAIWLWGGFSF